MHTSPLRPNPDALRDVGWTMREWHTGFGTSLCGTQVAANAHWQSHFEDIVLTQCLQPAQARFDFGDSRAWHPMSAADFLLLPARTRIDVTMRQSHESAHCALPLSLITAHESSGLRLEDLLVLFRRPFRSPWVSMLTSELWSEARGGFPRGRLFGEAAASLLAFALARAAGEQPVIHKGGLSPRQFRQTVERIEASLHQDVSLHALAGAAGLSVWHFSRAFRISAGMPLTEFVNRRRIERAQRRIAEAGISILEAASEAGFSSPSHFAKVFRRYTGMSPGTWKRTCG
jgi:AraC-like DNA-binding protein